MVSSCVVCCFQLVCDVHRERVRRGDTLRTLINVPFTRHTGFMMCPFMSRMMRSRELKHTNLTEQETTWLDTRCLCHPMSLSPDVSVTRCLRHPMSPSPDVSVTRCLRHPMPLSPDVSVTRCLCHPMSPSPDVSVTLLTCVLFRVLLSLGITSSIPRDHPSRGDGDVVVTRKVTSPGR